MNWLKRLFFRFYLPLKLGFKRKYPWSKKCWITINGKECEVTNFNFTIGDKTTIIVSNEDE